MNTQLQNRLKSLAWRVGAFALVGIIGIFTDILPTLGLDQSVTILVALVLAEVTKFLNTQV